MNFNFNNNPIDSDDGSNSSLDPYFINVDNNFPLNHEHGSTKDNVNQNDSNGNISIENKFNNNTNKDK